MQGLLRRMPFPISFFWTEILWKTSTTSGRFPECSLATSGSTQRSSKPRSRNWKPLSRRAGLLPSTGIISRAFYPTNRTTSGGTCTRARLGVEDVNRHRYFVGASVEYTQVVKGVVVAVSEAEHVNA